MKKRRGRLELERLISSWSIQNRKCIIAKRGSFFGLAVPFDKVYKNL